MSIQKIGGVSYAYGVDGGGGNATLTFAIGNENEAWLPGDFAIALWGSNGSTQRTNTALTGWTLFKDFVLDYGTGFLQLAMHYRKLVTGDPSSVVFAKTGGASVVGGGTLAIFRGVDPTTPFDVADVYSQLTSNTVTGTSPSITPVNPGSMILRIWQQDTAGGNGDTWISSVAAGTGILGSRLCGGSETSGSDEGVVMYGHTQGGAVASGTAVVTALNTNKWNIATLALRAATPSAHPYTSVVVS